MLNIKYWIFEIPHLKILCLHNDPPIRHQCSAFPFSLYIFFPRALILNKLTSSKMHKLKADKLNKKKLTNWQADKLQDDTMTWSLTLPWSLITILRLLSKVYRLKCLKFETKTHSLTHLLTRVKSRNASPANEKTSLLSLLAPKELYMWYYPALTTQHHPHFEHTPVLSNNFDYWCRDDFVDCDFYDH